ncbi:tRNA-dihydrouridine synthase [Candidatus Nomurabacteria bacterium]|nr:tRNA-dihydrouridine synthase [Candidatus Nomurabacteria bacterium]
MSFWSNLRQPFFILAPMEAVTDVIFRHVVDKAGGPDLYFSEFTNATGWVHAGDKAIGGRLVKTADETRLVAQIWGSVPDDIAKLSTHCKKLGFIGIDINMGCPDSSAVKAGGGAGMIRTPELASEIISSAKTSGLPVSAKTRLGYSSLDEWHDWLSHLLRQDISALTIHLRTKKEMSKVPAHFELIPDIVKLRDEIAPETLIIINGDIENRDHGLEIIKNNPGVNGIMIGRGVFHNPFCFNESSPDRTNKSSIKSAELIDLLIYHLELYDKWHEKNDRPYQTLKRFYKVYVRDFDGAKELREQLMNTKSTDEVREILGRIQYN